METKEAPVSYKKIWLIAFPIILGSIAQNVVSVTDTAFLGHVGKIALGASAIASLYYFSNVMLLWGFSIGTQIIIARRFGEKKYANIGKTGEHAFYIQMLLALFLLAIMQFFGSTILQYLVRSEEILYESAQFLRYRAWGILFAGANFVFRALYIGITKTKIISISAIIMAVINIFLDYVLIFGNWGFPQMGIEGAAIASVIAEITTTVIFIVYTKRKLPLQQYALFRWSKFDLSLQKNLLKISFPMMLQLYLSITSWFIFFLLVEKMGETELAVSNIIRSAFMLLLMPIWGFASAANTLTSQLLGKKQAYNVLPMIGRTIKLNLGLVVSIVGLGIIFPRLLINLYTNDLELIQTTLPVFYVICGAALFFSVSMTLFQSVSGTGNTMMALFIEIIVIVLYLLFAWFIIRYWQQPIHIVWFAENFYAIVLGLASFIYLRFGKWQQRKV